ncbi:MAG: hypothetical protein JST10_14725, partial [Bacteroidetes bacterium]|nr:hypothetical protein [Bacteroidota bacterium]
MKIVSITVLSFLFIFSAFRSWGQNEKIPLNEPDYNKPKVFQNLPDTIPVEASSLASLFSLSKGQKVAPDFSNKSATTGFQLRGEVISKSDDVP